MSSLRSFRAGYLAAFSCLAGGLIAQAAAAQTALAEDPPLPAPPSAPAYPEAWFTGPMLANTPATPAPGQIIGETFLFVEESKSSQLRGWLSFLSYGVTDRLAIGVKPLFGATRSQGQTLGPGIGDLTLLAQYRLTPPNASALTPTVAVLIQRGVPLGRYDRLDTNRAPGLGSGAPSTTLAVYAQQSIVLPNRHLARARINLSHTWKNEAKITGESVYGTSAGFRGTAAPGNSTAIILAGEYSISREWAVALDMFYERNRAGILVRDDIDLPRQKTGLQSSTSYGLAPAIEYNIRGDLGILVGTRFRLRGHNSPASVTPALALVFAFRP